METDLTEIIEQAAAKPQQAVSDGQSVTSRPLAELIEADQYLAAEAAMATRGNSAWSNALRPARVVPPGSI